MATYFWYVRCAEWWDVLYLFFRRKFQQPCPAQLKNGGLFIGLYKLIKFSNKPLRLGRSLLFSPMRIHNFRARWGLLCPPKQTRARTHKRTHAHTPLSAGAATAAALSFCLSFTALRDGRLFGTANWGLTEGGRRALISRPLLYFEYLVFLYMSLVSFPASCVKADADWAITQIPHKLRTNRGLLCFALFLFGKT